MLQLLKETVSSRHAERLEQIVIALIAVEIGKGTSRSHIFACAQFVINWVNTVLGIITIIVDLFS